MIISRTPYRISFFGGGTDYPAWYREHGGAVLATSIDKYAYLTCRYLPPFFEYKYRVVWSRIENTTDVEAIVHPAVRHIIKYLKIDRNIEVHHQGDLPARSGMGSSSSFTVGLLHALYALEGQMPGKRRLAAESITIEQDVIKENVGSQDQVTAAFGGLNRIDFLQNGEFSITPVTISRERIHELQSHLMLFYTGIARTAADVAESYTRDMDKKRRQLRMLRDMVDEGVSILAGGGDITRFGALLHEAWEAKRSLSGQVSNSDVDGYYQAARTAGAIGGKLMGAGGGGFMVLFVPPSRQAAVRETFSRLLHVPFNLEFSGSQIVFCDHELDYSHVERDRDQRPLQAFRELDLNAGAVAKGARK
jgi:D-glycero-alpha-D-manno-heptose-7-phosphate kinase